MKNENVKNLESKKRKKRAQNTRVERVDCNGLLSGRWSKYIHEKYEVLRFLRDCGIRTYMNYPNQGLQRNRKNKIEKHQWDTFGEATNNPLNVVLRWDNQNSPKVGGSLNFDNLHDSTVFALTILGLDPAHFNLPPKKMEGIYPNEHELWQLIGRDSKVVVEHPEDAGRTPVARGLVERMRGSDDLLKRLPDRGTLIRMRDDPSPRSRQRLEQNIASHLEKILASVKPIKKSTSRRTSLQSVLPLSQGAANHAPVPQAPISTSPAPSTASSKVTEHMLRTVRSMKEGLVAEIGRLSTQHKPLSTEVNALASEREVLSQKIAEIDQQLDFKKNLLQEVTQSLTLYQEMEEDVDRRIAELDPKHSMYRAMQRMEDHLKDLE